MSRRKESRYIFTPGISGAGTVKIPGKIDLSSILSIINTTANLTIYSLGEQGKGGSVTYTSGTDSDFPNAYDGITTINLIVSTSTMSSSDKLLILIEEDTGLTVRPHYYGADAMERIRISNPQVLLETDFEYGTQTTKWQHLSLNQNYPTFADSSVSFFSVSTINAAAAVNGFSTITITLSAANPPNFPAAGDSIYVSGTTNNFANGVFLVTTVAGGNTITYQSKGNIPAGSILTTTARVRRAVTITGSQLPTNNLTADGSTTITGNFVAGNVHNLVPGSPIVVYDPTAGNQNYESNYFISEIPNGTTFRYIAGAAQTAGTISTASVYSKPDSYALHRPFDGGVSLGSYYPVYGLKTIRQTKRTFRYQSGKSMFYSTGAQFTPVLAVESATSVVNVITINTTPFHGLQDTAQTIGATVVLSGITTPGYNGIYTVNSITSDTSFTVVAGAPPAASTAVLGENPTITISQWHGACIRTGLFDDTNGLFWEYDGQSLYAVKRSSTFQLAGSLTVTSNSQAITGTGTRFLEQLRNGDFVVIRGQAYQVSSITSNTTMTIAPEFRGATTTAGVPYAKVVDTRIKQSEFNGDKLDGSGPSGYNLDITKMQMIGIQYTWYGAGYADFMLRGPDGEYILAHRITNNNKNTEAYMRSGNLPSRYETYTASNATPYLTVTSGTAGGGALTLNDTSTYPSQGAVLLTSNQAGTIVKEVIRYSGKTSTQLTGISRAETYNAYLAGSLRSFTGNAAAVDHPVNTTVQLMTVTCAPQITHWGSTVIMDGQYNETTSNLFSLARPSFALGANTTSCVLGFRPAPTVSEGIPGLIGEREILNRAFTQLQSIEVINNTANTVVEVLGVINPISTAQIPAWTSVANTVLGANTYYQPSFVQSTQTVTTAPAGAEVLFVTYSGQGRHEFDLTQCKELQNSIVGGDGYYPNGPDTLFIVLRNTTATATTVSVALTWKEVQA